MSEKFSVDFKFKKKLSTRQKLIVNNLISNNWFNEVIRYKQTFEGKGATIHLPTFINKRDTSPIDPLENKKPNEVLNMAKKMYSPMIEHKPREMQIGDWIGVEIECKLPSSEYDISMECSCSEETIDDCGCECNYTDDATYALREQLVPHFEKYKIKNVQVVDDGSINFDSSDEIPVEFRVLTRISDMSNLERLCKYLNDKGATVNSSCGLHVHLDGRDLKNSTEVHKRANRLVKALPILTQLVPKSRLNNSYCIIGKSRMNGERYYAVNLTSFKKHKTIEVRLHSGTTDYEKISNWVKLLYSISRNDKIKKPVDNLEKLFSFLKLDNDAKSYFYKRIDKFRVKDDVFTTLDLNKLRGHLRSRYSYNEHTVIISNDKLKIEFIKSGDTYTYELYELKDLNSYIGASERIQLLKRIQSFIFQTNDMNEEQGVA